MNFILFNGKRVRVHIGAIIFSSDDVFSHLPIRVNHYWYGELALVGKNSLEIVGVAIRLGYGKYDVGSSLEIIYLAGNFSLG